MNTTTWNLTPASSNPTVFEGPHASSDDAKTRIIEYYRQLDASYRRWGVSEAYELHYGHHDDLPGVEDRSEDDHARALVRMTEVMAERASIRPGDRVLDAGCGVGASALWLAAHRGCQVEGISLSEHQIGLAREFASRAQDPSRLGFAVRDFSATGLPDASFDVVWGLESICYAQDKRLFLAEALRLLRPGGRLVVADYFLESEPRSGIERHSLERWLDGWVIPHLPRRTQFHGWIAGAGFVEGEDVDITENIRPSAEEIYRRGKAGYPDDILGKGKNALQIQHVEACLFQKVCLDLGLWRYRIFTARKEGGLG